MTGYEFFQFIEAILLIIASIGGIIVWWAIFGTIGKTMAEQRGRDESLWGMLCFIFTFTAMFVLFCIGETEEHYHQRLINEAKILKSLK